MSPRTALRLVWLLFALLIAALVALPAVAQAPQVEREIGVYVDADSGLAVIRWADLRLLQAANQQLATDLRRLREKTGCL